MSVSYIWIFGLGIYLLAARVLRHRRAQSYSRRYNGSSVQLTNKEAHAILKDLTELEFPKLFGFSIIFALFKTYGVPAISSLLVSTAQLADHDIASKRVADTGVLILEFALNEPDSDRAIDAISRMNFLHQSYQKAGKIRNNDMLYTLSLFALEPARWVGKYEWRPLTDIELCACGTYWKALGDAMEISFDVLPSSKKGWRNGREWLDEVEKWSLKYECAEMHVAQSNRELAGIYLELVFYNVPKRLRPFCHRIVSVLLGERLRSAMILPEPTGFDHAIVSITFGIRKVLLRHFFLPRPEVWRKRYIPDGPNSATGKYNAREYLSSPWYVQSTLLTRWGPRALLTRIVGRKVPGDDGDKYMPQGWTHTSLGPPRMVGKGTDFMASSHAKLKAANRGGCPFKM